MYLPPDLCEMSRTCMQPSICILYFLLVKIAGRKLAISGVMSYSESARISLEKDRYSYRLDKITSRSSLPFNQDGTTLPLGMNTADVPLSRPSEACTKRQVGLVKSNMFGTTPRFNAASHTVSKRQEPGSRDWHLAVAGGPEWTIEWSIDGSRESHRHHALRRPTKTGERRPRQDRVRRRTGVPSPHKVSFQKISTGGKQEPDHPLC